MSERLTIGRIAKAHGILGEVAIEIHTDVPDRFVHGATVRVDPDLDLTIKSARPHQGRVLVRFEGIGDRSSAEALRGRWLSVDAESTPDPADPWSFWEFQLDGAIVVDTHGRRLGVFARAEHGKGDDLWVVATPDGEVFVPAVRAIVREVNVDAKTIVLDPPEGLFA